MKKLPVIKKKSLSDVFAHTFCDASIHVCAALVLFEDRVC